MLRSEAIEIFKVVRKEQKEDMTPQRNLGVWALSPDSTVSLVDNHILMSYNNVKHLRQDVNGRIQRGGCMSFWHHNL